MDTYSFRGVKKMFTVIILCVVTRVCTSQIFKCDDGWTLYKDNCYYFSDTGNLKKTRDDALRYCHDNDSYLVAVTNADINDFLYNNSRTHHDDFYWIGLRHFAGNTYGWNDGSVDDGIPWGNREPSNNLPCAWLRNKLFNDVKCLHANDQYAICERDTEPDARGSWTQHEDHWYMLTAVKMSQLEAVPTCISEDGYLARLTTDEERNNILIPTTEPVWAGVTKLVWDGGSGYNWHFWRETHTPDYKHNTYCAVLDREQDSWEMKNCKSQYYFICNREPSVEVPQTASSLPTTEETTAVFQTTQSTNSIRRTDVTFKTSILTVNGTKISESSQISPKDRVLQYVLFAIYAMVILMLLVDSVLLVIYMELRKSSRTQVDDKSQIRKADSAPVENNVYSEVDDFILPTEHSNAPIYSIPHKSSIHV